MPHQVDYSWQVLVMIVLGWTAVAFFLLAGRKAFFEPFKGAEEDKSSTSQPGHSSETH